MSAVVTHFMKLHHKSKLFMLINVWDAASLVLAQENGADAVATSSAALGWSLGYADGSALPVDELLAAVQRLLRISKVPLSVDIEQGYSNNPQHVAILVKQLADMGIAGINLEDGNNSPELLAEKIKACRQLLGEKPLFINARTDVYLEHIYSSHTVTNECINRLKLFQEAGASGVFIPGLHDLKVVKEVHQQLSLPINLMGWPLSVTTHDLTNAGVTRISSGPGLFLECYSHYQQACSNFLKTKISDDDALLDYAGMNKLFS